MGMDISSMLPDAAYTPYTRHTLSSKNYKTFIDCQTIAQAKSVVHHTLNLFNNEILKFFVTGKNVKLLMYTAFKL